QANGTQTGTLTISTLSGGNTGTLNLKGADVLVAAHSVSVGSDTTLASDDMVTVNVADTGTGSLALQSNGRIVAAEDLNIQATTGTNNLLVTMASGSELVAGSATVSEGFDLNFNPTTAGNITVDGGAGPVFNGTLKADGDKVTFRGGLVNVKVNTIVGTITVTGALVAVEANSGLTTGQITSTGTAVVKAGGVL